MKPINATLLILLASQIPIFAEKVHTPAIGSPDRVAIMDVLRLDIYKDPAKAKANADKILYRVYHLKIKDGWACMSVVPTKDGREVAEPRWEVMRKIDGEWQEVDYFEKLRPFASEAAAMDALDMSKDSVKRLLPKLPGCPREIFP